MVATFIVRLTRDPAGRLRGTVERARTGEKARVARARDVGAVIWRMLGEDGGGRPRRQARS
jgi:hypothetical protein